MNGLKTFARSLSLADVNAAFRNAAVKDVPEIDVMTYTFALANTPYTIPHALGKIPEIAKWIGEAASNIYANSADKLLWTDTQIVLRINVAATGILEVEAR